MESVIIFVLRIVMGPVVLAAKAIGVLIGGYSGQAAGVRLPGAHMYGDFNVVAAIPDGLAALV